MKKIHFIFCLLFVLVFGFCFGAEASTVYLNDSVVQSMVESALKNGFSQHKDVQAMLDNALLNGYDYCSVECNEKSGAFVINVAIDGLSSVLTALDNDKSDNSIVELAQAKETLILHGKAVFDLFKTVGREDANFMFILVDDEPLFKYNFTEHRLLIITFKGGEANTVFSTSIDAW